MERSYLVDSPIRSMIREMAERNFAEHKIEVLRNDGFYRHFSCAKPGTKVYWFDIITFPMYLVIVGDIGHLILARDTDMLLWANRSVNELPYFAEKVVQSIPIKEYSEEKAKKVIAERIEQLQKETMVDCEDCDGSGKIEVDFNQCPTCHSEEEHAEKCATTVKCKLCFDGKEVNEDHDNWDEIQELRNIDTSFESEAYAGWRDATGDMEVSFMDYNSNVVWCREAVIWFLNNWKDPSNPRQPKPTEVKDAGTS